MDMKDIQTLLAARGWYTGKIDGVFGAKTRAAIEKALYSTNVDFSRWGDPRKITAAYQFVCSASGIDAGKIDGLEGPQTRYAMEVFDARKSGDKSAETWRDEAPAPTTPQATNTVWPTQAGVRKFYGEPGANQAMLSLPYSMRLAWDKDTVVKRISIHEKCHDSAERVLKRVLDHYGPEKIAELGLDLFGGCLNVRTMRGGSAMSMHSWGIAIDFDPDRNQLKWAASPKRDANGKLMPAARLAKPDAEKFWQLWEAEGWVSLGRHSNYDWMHVQAARL